VLTTDSIGLLEVRGAQLGAGQGWVRTTDLATIDDDGFVWIKGRIDDAIVRGGFKIVPTELQRVFDSHPAIRESAVVGLPDHRLGAVPVVAVELNEGAGATVEELMDFARQNLIGYQVPTQIRIVEALPRTPSLKVSRPLVVELFE